MPQSKNHLPKVFSDAFKQLSGSQATPEVEVKFYPYAGLRHTIRIRSGRVYVRISDVFKTAPPEVIRALAFILVGRLLSRKAPRIYDRVYRQYAFTPQVLRASEIARRHRGRKVISSARGQFYDLEKLFARLNRRYFEGSVEKPVLTWSQRRTRNILGHHDPVHETITISKTLDAADVPEWFVEFILFHEMLHIKHPARIVRGRRQYHSQAFRADEQRFHRYQQAQDWLDQVVRQQHVLRARAA
ncbi:MAG: SprT-like domain-containing protein [Pyrinomonadaceae bacterium]